ncbi:hypothetical protein L195_g009991 [Trifolium pratense]|uniref:Uncharacterized protein n=1 Tax=Trifolium pratense TaxID=57577 RepID=A0A2K3PCL8_TRIPR|nr:hypothetical protein L195_g002696 [Trifolium pratense]PNY13040.1 hypothetical protein L195_g009687 [Trifolium pratense]PNY13338.1 hypothetical protein L195_g009991 [Trifolium pratense]
MDQTRSLDVYIPIGFLVLASNCLILLYSPSLVSRPPTPIMDRYSSLFAAQSVFVACEACYLIWLFLGLVYNPNMRNFTTIVSSFRSGAPPEEDSCCPGRTIKASRRRTPEA